VFALTTVLTAAPALAQGNGNNPNNTGVEIPVVSTTPGQFSGSFTLLRFVATEEGLVAVGRLVGTATNTAGEVLSIARLISIPVGDLTAENATCEILSLDLGPLNLDLLGLVIDLSDIQLDITAVPGAGNLLGNLLCSVAGLLDNDAGLARVLNRILGILQG
jgi:hypothetical protein